MNKIDLVNALKKFMKEHKIKQTDLAGAMRVQQSIISDMLNGKRRIDRLVEYINTTYGTNFEMPVEGSNVVLVEAQEKKHFLTNSNGIKFFEQEDGSLLMEVPKVPYFALGSPDDEFATLYNNNENTDPVMLKVDKVHHGKYLAFDVVGDSMDDGTRKSFEHGDTVVVRELDKSDWMPRLYINQWKYWVVCWGNCVRLKQIIDQDVKNGTITLHSLNPSPEYVDFTLRLDEITRLFNVISKEPKTQYYAYN